jgi:HlyD family secretion protein
MRVPFSTTLSDTPLRVVRPRSWCALAALGAVIAGAGVWSVFGSVYTTVNGDGVLIRSGGLIKVVSLDGGPVSAIYVRQGDVVKSHQKLAFISHPLLELEASAARTDRDRLRAEYQELVKLAAQGDLLYAQTLATQRSAIDSSIAARARRLEENREAVGLNRTALKQQRIQLDLLVATLERRLEAERKLFSRVGQLANTGSTSARELETDRRLVTEVEDRLKTAQTDVAKHSVALADLNSAAHREIDQNEEAIEAFRVQLAALDREEVDRSTRQQELISAKRSALRAIEERTDVLQKRQELCDDVVSPADGRVVEIKVNVGDLLTAGTTVLTIEMTKQPLELAAFVPAGEGKKLEPGMRVELTPSTVYREEYGFMVGTVRSVSQFAVSEQGLQSLLANRKLVDELTKKGASIALEIDMQTDSASPSGYRWSTGRGPNLTIESGTTCQVRIVTREQPPITLVLPLLRKFFGVE